MGPGPEIFKMSSCVISSLSYHFSGQVCHSAFFAYEGERSRSCTPGSAPPRDRHTLELSGKWRGRRAIQRSTLWPCPHTAACASGLLLQHNLPAGGAAGETPEIQRTLTHVVHRQATNVCLARDGQRPSWQREQADVHRSASAGRACR
jgi:hypothetical protein